ncbi:hypothetical protein ATCC90586_004680 [Pythium insidiosum]|nr:hypothetical protein ATCC90586_004680 [Pythium insidiosum]
MSRARQIRAVLIDLSGTLHIDDTVIPGAIAALDRLLQERDIGVRFEEFDGVDRENPNAVVVGLAPGQFHYDRLNEAFRVLLNGGKLIALHEARYHAVKGGLNLGPGAFVRGLEYAAGVQATVIGKPAPSFFQQALQDMYVLL